MQARRGFTLIEVLVAIGLLVVISSLAVPVALTNTESARARTAERILSLAPGVARGEAQRTGGPVALVLAPPAGADGPLRLLIVREPDPARGDAADQNADPGDVATWPPVDEPRDLPLGTRLWEGEIEQFEAFEAQAQDQTQARGPVAPRAFTEDDARGSPAGPAGTGEPMDAVVLAWYLSDGSAMAGRATVVRLADGRVVRVRVEPLVGRLVFTPAPELEEGAEAPQDEGGEPPERGAGDEPAGARGGMDAASEPGGRGLDRAGLDRSGFDRPEFDRPEFERPEFGNPQFDVMEFGSRGFDDLAFDRPEFDRPEFERPQFDMMEFGSREFDDLDFDTLEFDRLDFDELGEPGAGQDRRDESQEQERDEGERTNPEPPQPR